MNTYYITYRTTTDHDITTVWCEANNPEEAADYVISEYWDVEEILFIRRK